MTTITTVTPQDLGNDFDIGIQTPDKITIKNGVFSGTGAPVQAFGNDGQYYIDEKTGNGWGPKNNGSWPVIPNYYGNQGNVLLTANSNYGLDYTVLNTIIEISPANTDNTVSVTIPPPFIPGTKLVIWNNSSVSHQIRTNAYGGFSGPAIFETNTNTFYAQPDDSISMIADGSNWIIQSYITLATTTQVGFSRKATTSEMSTGVTVGNVAAFVTPEGLAAYVSATSPANVVIATNTVAGISRIATQTEVNSGVTTTPIPAFVTAETLNSLLLSLPLMLSGQGSPANNLGQIGYYYIDSISSSIYGPKTSNGWGQIVNNVTTVNDTFGTTLGTIS